MVSRLWCRCLTQQWRSYLLSCVRHTSLYKEVTEPDSTLLELLVAFSGVLVAVESPLSVFDAHES